MAAAAVAKNNKIYDIIIYGATGFTGQLVVQHLAKNYQKSALTFAIAGRSKSKLEQVKEQADWPQLNIVIADSSQPQTVDHMVAQTKVLLSTAGPFALYGTPVVQACIKHKTHYVDITGEYTWVRSIIDQFDEQAKQDGTLIVPMCGYDSIPSDLGSFLLHQDAQNKHTTVNQVEAVFSGNGSASGGTIASICNLLESPTQALVDAAHPFYLHPGYPKSFERSIRAEDKDVFLPTYIKEHKTWTAPFVMASANSRVVRRSAALVKYGAQFSYRETMKAANFFVALFITLGLGLVVVLLTLRPTRSLLQRFVLPAPGQGPSAEKRARSWFRSEFVGVYANGEQGRVSISGGCPGYSETSKMVAEAALSLALQLKELPSQGGVLTPASAFGQVLVNRLQSQGIKIEVNKQK